MKKLYIKILLFCFTFFVLLGICYTIFFHKEISNAAVLLNESELQTNDNFFFIGTKKGLYKIQKTTHKLLDEEVVKILPSPLGIWALTHNNIFFSSDYTNFIPKSNGIRQKVIKWIHNNQTEVIRENELLKDISFDPYNPNNIITAGINGIYYSTNNGDSWTYVPSKSATNGIKSVGIYSWNNQIHLLFGHPYQGIYHKTLNQTNWTIISKGLARVAGFKDEIASIVILRNGDKPPRILAAQNFDPVIFELNIDKRLFTPIYIPKKKDDVEMMESLQQDLQKNLIYVNNQGIKSYNPKTKTLKDLNKIQIFIDQFAQKYDTPINSISTFYQNKNLYSISELWMLQPPLSSKYHQAANHKRGVYVQTDVLRSTKRFPELLAMLKATNQNMIVVDMKDDFGGIRFKTDNPILNKANAIRNPLDLKTIIPILKKAGIYIVARIPAFKDPILFKYNNGEYAVKDKKTGNSWVGLKKTKSGNFVPTKEYWLDPYNEKVWEYNIVLSQELIKHGFDEIQFDYIRFPTDGVNLSSASYPAQIQGMDKESALISFLKYARENIHAPISIDIYGANGWMRTGSRTGQDVELLSLYADVISPMYYPSHFGNSFLNFPPYEERPYRIYKQGSYRNYYIARKKSIIRPYLQAFNLSGNPYDKQYYNEHYINRQIEGVNESINLGYTFWNSSTKYSILYRTVLTKSS